MARYVVDLQKASASTTASLGVINAEATGSLTRFKVYDLMFGSEATPADAAILWTVTRFTVAGTTTAVTPIKLDPQDRSAGTEAGENATIEPTYTTGPPVENLLNIPLNQRATFRWVAAPGGELVGPATDENGMGIQTDTISTGTPAITATVHFEE